MTKTKEELARELSDSATNIKDVQVPRYVVNPGLYIGFIKGWEAAMEHIRASTEAKYQAVFVYPNTETGEIEVSIPVLNMKV